MAFRLGLPLTLTLSPQAGRGDRAALDRSAQPYSRFSTWSTRRRAQFEERKVRFSSTGS
jgi:hypothetical protein